MLQIAPVKPLGRDFPRGGDRCRSRTVCREVGCAGLGFEANVVLRWGWIWGLSLRWVALLCSGPRGDSHVPWPALAYLFKTKRGVYTNSGQGFGLLIPKFKASQVL